MARDGVLGCDVGKSAGGMNWAAFARRAGTMYLDMIFRDGFFHADPHTGNYVVLRGGVVGVLNCGMVGRLDEGLREDFEGALRAVTERDVEELTERVTVSSRRQAMAVFHTILHPTDFDTPSLEAFRVARELARTLGAKVVALHVAAPPAVVTQQGWVIRSPKEPAPVDLWATYRAAQADSPGVAIEYSVAVGKEEDATRMLWDLIGGNPAGVLIVMGTHGRTGVGRMVWGSRAEEVVRSAPCAVLVVKEPPAGSGVVTTNSPSE